MPDLAGIRRMYAQLAAAYERQVIPAFGPLAASLADWVAACVAAHRRGALFDPFDLPAYTAPLEGDHSRFRALDVGTGTGVLARACAQRLGAMFGRGLQVTGLDLSPEMLREARHIMPNLAFAAADLHRLPVRRGQLDLISSAFGLNASTPPDSLRALARALRPGGLLIFQEWGAEDELSRLVDEILEQHAPEDIPGMDDALRAFLDEPRPWYDRLQDSEDYYEMLKSVGFEYVWAREAVYKSVHLPSAEAFLAYKLAWPSRRLPLEAMSPVVRAACESALRAALQPHTNGDGSLNWSPALFRVCAIRRNR